LGAKVLLVRTIVWSNRQRLAASAPVAKDRHLPRRSRPGTWNCEAASRGPLRSGAPCCGARGRPRGRPSFVLSRSLQLSARADRRTRARRSPTPLSPTSRFRGRRPRWCSPSIGQCRCGLSLARVRNLRKPFS